MGPGSYDKPKSIFDEVNNARLNRRKANLSFGKVDRFPSDSKRIPGPGAYNDLNKWHKKTFNLKFLNV